MRAEIAARCNLTSGVATPIIVGRKFRGLIEVFTARQLTREPELLDLLKVVGNEIGQFIRSRRLDEKFRDEEARKTAILRSALDCIVTMDVAGRIVNFNPAAERTFGYRAADVIGRPLNEVIIPEEYRDAHAQGLVRFLQSGESEILGKRIELPALRSDGETFPIELAINVSHARDGSPFFTGYLRDITERRRADEILSQRAKLAELHATLAVSLAGTAPLDEILRKCSEHLVAVLNATSAQIWLTDDRHQELNLTAFADRASPFYRDDGPVSIGQSTVGRIAASRQPVLSNDLSTDSMIDEPQWMNREGVHAYAGYPLVVEDRVVGVMDLFADHELIPEVISQLQPMADAMAQSVARKVAEQATLDRESHLRRVIDNMLGFVGELDLDGTLLEVNETALSSGGLDREDVVGKKFWDCYWWNFDPKTIETLQDALRRAAAGELVRYDTVVRMAGDTRMTIDFMLVPVSNEAGEITHLIPSGVDITDRIDAEVALKNNEERLRMALKAGQMAAWEWNPQESIWTDALYDLLDVDKDLVASPELFFKNVHPDDVANLRQAWQAAVEGRASYESEFRIIRPDGSIRWMIGLGEVVRDQNGNVIQLFGLNWDVTTEHEVAETLRESERKAQLANLAKSEFLANMSHEIRTPMTAILGYTDLLGEQIERAEAKTLLQTIRRNGDFLLEIINDILDLSKIEAGKLDISRETFELERLIEDVRSIMDVRANENGLNLEVEYKDQIPQEIESDPKRLKQILINLVGNAIKFTREGTVRIVIQFLQQPKPTLEITVVNTGIGMTRQQQERLFKPFSQGDSSVTREFGGTGLGLAISHRLVTLLGGQIESKSEEGAGSEFRFTVSVGDVSKSKWIEPRLAVPMDAINESVDETALDCHVLVVDDSRDIRFLSRHLLTAPLRRSMRQRMGKSPWTTCVPA